MTSFILQKLINTVACDVLRLQGDSAKCQQGAIAVGKWRFDSARGR